MNDVELICIRCNKPVEKNYEYYDVFEKMHWLCFHLEFEHEGDPDEPCEDLSCPWWRIEIYNEKLKKLGVDPGQVFNEAINERWQQ